MKTIEPISIWDNGTAQSATVLNAYAINVALNNSATFWYGLIVQNANGGLGNTVAQGNLVMGGEAYTEWNLDNYAWDWVAEQLNLTITGDYTPPAPAVIGPLTISPEPIIEPVIE